MKLVSVYACPAAKTILFDLLSERKSEESISHRAMPTWAEHENFVDSQPYRHWYLIAREDEKYVGACYLTHDNEIGIGILSAYKGNGYGPRAVRLLMSAFPGARLLANINPANTASIRMFEKLGFRHCQNTYERRP